MSIVDEDTELRDILIQTLDKNGVLGKIKAELRASVFLALEAEDNVKNPSALANVKLQDFLRQPEADLCVDVIRDFLEHFNLDYTSAVFCPETNTTSNLKSRDYLFQKLNFSQSATTSDTPVLASMVKDKTGSNLNSNSPNDALLKTAQELFTQNCSVDSDFITVPSAVHVLSLLCPKFPVFLLERFVAEEKNSLSQEISSQAFIAMYVELYQACLSVISDQQPTSKNENDPTSLIKSQISEDRISQPDVGYSEKKETSASSGSNSGSSQDEAPTSTFDHFFDDDYYSKPKDSPTKFTDSRPANSMKLPPLTEPSNVVSHVSDPSSKGDWNGKEKSAPLNYDHKQLAYDDDFNSTSQASISEELQGNSLLSSTQSSMAELTEDHSIDEKDIGGDYMEEVKKY